MNRQHLPLPPLLMPIFVVIIIFLCLFYLDIRALEVLQWVLVGCRYTELCYILIFLVGCEIGLGLGPLVVDLQKFSQ